MSGTPADLMAQVAAGSYVDVLTTSQAQTLIHGFTSSLHAQPTTALSTARGTSTTPSEEVAVGLAAFNAFLQVNITGPVLEGAKAIQDVFVSSIGSDASLRSLRRDCLAQLEIDGVTPYAHIPHLELFALAKHIFATTSASITEPISLDPSQPTSSAKISLPWLRLRVSVWHYRLLTQPSLSGSSFAKSMQWIDVPSLAEDITAALAFVKATVLGEDVWSLSDAEAAWSREDKVQLLLEAANVYIMLGQDEKARESVAEAAKVNSFVYALSGALGKRTKFQQNSTSQLVVLAKSSSTEDEATKAAQLGDEDEENDAEKRRPDALALNDDTLLEKIEFSKGGDGANGEVDEKKAGIVPDALMDLAPDDQPQLSALDQIVLLTEATLKDSFSAADALTSEEVLPYAVRVVSDKSTNWQIYTQALLVRSRIELHRSRTMERGILQMQAVVDQVVVDTEQAAAASSAHNDSDQKTDDVPAIAVTGPETETAPEVPADKPTSFFRAAKSTESAPAQTRLQFIHALASPPRWHLESELAYSWAAAGSLISALEIFRRLRLWAEVALCLATASAASESDDTGRGSGGERKARGILRWRLFHRTGSTPGDTASPNDPDDEVLDSDAADLDPASFMGALRNPAPPNAPRLLCILGDIENEASHYEQAWTVSNHRYARAQKSLGESYIKQKDLVKAREAYEAATNCNRLSAELWTRLGDIDLQLGHFASAADVYRRAIAAAGDPVGGEDPRTWSNLGTALWSQYLETVKDIKARIQKSKLDGDDDNDNNKNNKPSPAAPLDDEDDTHVSPPSTAKKEADPSTLIAQSLAAFKRGAAIASDNWRIWDNVLTISVRCQPPSYVDTLRAQQAILTIRKSEAAIDADVLRMLLQDLLLSGEKENDTDLAAVYDPPRGTIERTAILLFEDMVVPLITSRSELWELISRLRVWRRDYKGAIDAAEKGWRAAMGSAAGVSGGLMPDSAGGAKSWLEDQEAFDEVVSRTDELVSVLENYGEQTEGVGAKWRGKARSAVRSVMSKARDPWEGTNGWKVLEGLMEGLERK